LDSLDNFEEEEEINLSEIDYKILEILEDKMYNLGNV
jgi:hypothetical protein